MTMGDDTEGCASRYLVDASSRSLIEADVHGGTTSCLVSSKKNDDQCKSIHDGYVYTLSRIQYRSTLGKCYLRFI